MKAPFPSTYFNVWSSVDGTFWEGLGGMPFVGDVSLGVGFKTSKAPSCTRVSTASRLRQSCLCSITRDGHPLEPQTNETLSFLKLPWSSRCLVTAVFFLQLCLPVSSSRTLGLSETVEIIHGINCLASKSSF